ncbi:MAG: Gfo/Idh/MocA family oxidoreductase [Pseudomonadota bacterium]
MRQDSKPPGGSRLRVALVGLGNVGAIHLSEYLKSDTVNLVAVVEPRAARMDELSVPAKIGRFTDLGEMLSIAAPDAVSVATPVATHASVTEACAAAGAHVLCEKPIAIALEDAKDMLSACEAAGVSLGYAASYRFLPAVLSARQLIRDGAVGEVILLQEQAVGGARMGGGQAMGFAHYPEGGPGGSGMGLVDHGIHFVDIFPWLIDSEIVSVSGRGNVSGAPLQTEWLSMIMANGATGHLLYNENVHSTTLPAEGMFSAGEGWDVDIGLTVPGAWSVSPGCIHVAGTEGALRIFHYAHRLFHCDAKGWQEVALTGAPPPAHFGLQMEAFLNAVAQGDPPPVPGVAGLLALEHLLSIYS